MAAVFACLGVAVTVTLATTDGCDVLLVVELRSVCTAGLEVDGLIVSVFSSVAVTVMLAINVDWDGLLLDVASEVSLDIEDAELEVKGLFSIALPLASMK